MNNMMAVSEITVIVGAIMAVAGAWIDNTIGMIIGDIILIIGVAARFALANRERR